MSKHLIKNSTKKMNKIFEKKDRIKKRKIKYEFIKLNLMIKTFLVIIFLNDLNVFYS